jgi:hypothetical protein
MKRFGKLCILSTLGFLLAAPGWACGPFLFANSDLDSLALLDPGIVGDAQWAPFYLYASPGFGQTANYQQEVIAASRVTMELSDSLTNLVWDYDAGSDPAWVSGNRSEWLAYLRLANGKAYSSEQVKAALDGKGLPQGARGEDSDYFALLFSAPANDPALEKTAAERARETPLPLFLRERYAYLALRAAATGSQDKPTATAYWQEFKPLFAHPSLVAGRALAWIAGNPDSQNPPLSSRRQLADFLHIFDVYPALRVMAYVSLENFSDNDWSSYLAQKLDAHQRELALFARFELEDRDFSPDTLNALVQADPGSSMALAAAYKMTEEVEREAGDNRLLALTFDPATWSVGPDSLPSDQAIVASLQKKGLYTALVESLEQAGLNPAIRFPRAWLTLASYLAFFDGDEAQMTRLYQKSLTFPALNSAQEHQSHLLGTLLGMLAQRQTPWDAALQKRLIVDLVWAKSLDQPGHNRGLYHSLVVLAAQKDLALDRLGEAARAFDSLQTDTWNNPYYLAHNEYFWSTSWGANDPVNLLFDVLLRPVDLENWQNFLKTPPDQRAPLDGFLAQRAWLTPADLDYLASYKDLRQGRAAQALPLVQKLTQDGYFTGVKTWRNDESVFPVRQFSFSETVDVVNPESGAGIKGTTLLELTQTMLKLESGDPVVLGNFWFSLQLSGFPLIFASPPPVISFVNNWEYFSYDGTDVPTGDGSAAADFPLFQPRLAPTFRRALLRFQVGEFSDTHRALDAYRQATVRDKAPESRALAWAMIATLGQDKNALIQLASPIFRNTDTYQNLRSNCETLRSFL